MSKKKNLGYGLQPLPTDDRDFKLGSVFGAPSLADIPQEDFVIGESGILNQGSSDLCTAFATAKASEFQEGVNLSPEYTFAKTKELMGEWEEWGADLRVACKAGKDFGFLPLAEAPLTLGAGRDYVANWAHWHPKLDVIAKKYAKQSFFSVEAYDDLFDSIRANLWRFRGEKRAIITGAMWRSEWTNSGGVIPKQYGDSGFGHAFLFIGQKKIEGKWHLVAQLSNGTNIGDKGFFYFPKEVVNKECVYGNFMFKDLPPAEAKFLTQNNLSVKWRPVSFLARWVNLILNLI